MYAQHQPKIAVFANASPDNMIDVALFCILSARQPLDRVYDDFREVKDGKLTALWSWKGDAYREMVENRWDRFETLKSINANTKSPHKKADLMMDQVITWKGLGLAKGGFFLQMMFGVSGCMDSRNLDLFEINNRAFRTDHLTKAKPSTRMRKIRSYHNFIKRLGGTARLWDIWCDLYAEQRGTIANGLTSGWAVSAYHCEVLGIDPGDPPEAEDIPFD